VSDFTSTKPVPGAPVTERTVDTDRTEPGPPEAPTPVPPPPTARVTRHTASPRVRRLLRTHGLDLSSVQPTGRHGRATEDDVREAVSRLPSTPSTAPLPPAAPVTPPEPAERPAASARGRVESLSRRRRAIAERVHRSLQESAQLTTVIEADLTSVTRARETAQQAFEERYGVPLSVLAFVAEAAVASLAEHPILHAELDLATGTVTFPSRVDLGIGVETREGLVVPVVRGADDLTVGGLSRRIAELVDRACDGFAAADDFAGGSFTITDTGSRGALFDTPILSAPQSATLGLGAVTRRPVAAMGADGDELIVVRSMAYLSLTYDHRLVDGSDAAGYLASLKKRLESNEGFWAKAVGLQEQR